MEFASEHGSQPPANDLWERVRAAIIQYEQLNDKNYPSQDTLIGLLYEVYEEHDYLKNSHINDLKKCLNYLNNMA